MLGKFILKNVPFFDVKQVEQVKIYFINFVFGQE